MQKNKEYMLDWLCKRKVSDTVLQDFNIHIGTHPTIGECIVIPVHDEHGNFLFNKYRRNPLSEEKPKYLYDIGGKVTLYGANKIKESDTVLVTEGELDCLTAWSANIPAVTSTGGALSFQREWVSFFENKKVILCFDNDSSGADGMVKILSSLPKAHIAFIPLQPGVKDISDFVSRGGDLHALLKTARCFSDIEDVRADRSERLAVWLPTVFHDAYLSYFEKPVTEHAPRVYRGDELEYAKAYPIHNIVKFTANKAPCLWHKEKTPSLHYFKDTNKVYCFGCGKLGDAIDVFMAVNNVSFKEAIKRIRT